MIQSRMVGEVRVTRLLEYAAPTHDPAFLFPDMAPNLLKDNASWLAPHHYVPQMHRLIVTIQLWIVHAGGNVIIVDTGVGNRKPRAAARMHQLNGLVLPWLEAAGAAPDTVTHVVHTHLHSDHVGWNTVLSADGRWVPTFPNARYLMPKLEYDHYVEALAQSPDPIIDAAFDDSIRPIVAAGLADFIPDHGEIADVLAIEAAPGHSVGHQTYRIRSRGEEGLFSGDVMHSPAQIVDPTLNTTYCALPDVARRTRAALLAREAERGTLVMPMHFGAPHCGYIRRQGEGYAFEPAGW
ncbi:MBL fold metallo-hydrolase [Xanthobacter oligotrophicus]|uniref:MBL fold metallo-hydrolase n=1 Tax=Xanthobacter oligotrophicus TaxID=2607286 RepID=UPI0011F0E29E|nr:MBL fold metallo-hydrolase [Xanthobacter oligotrophicus]MCG5236177.1 MBL fold metallo-hydrolase [Xanthobacter oligotrophicus]